MVKNSVGNRIWIDIVRVTWDHQMMNSRPGSEIADGIVQWIVFFVGEMYGKPCKNSPKFAGFLQVLP